MKARLAFVVAALLLVSAAPSMGADLVFSPTNLMMTLPGGQSGSTLAGVSVRNVPSGPFTVKVRLQKSGGGTLPIEWLTTREVSITETALNQQIPLAIAVPSTAGGGPYTATFVPAIVEATGIKVGFNSKLLRVTVVVLQDCSAAPTISIDPPNPVALWPPNGRIENVAVTGRISVPAGCTLTRTWYEVEDEYGPSPDPPPLFTPAADNTFSLTVPVEVSRRGDDKDGRVYRVTVRAEDRAGIGASAPLIMTVGHDQGKEK